MLSTAAVRLGQLAALPVALVALGLTVAPRHRRPASTPDVRVELGGAPRTVDAAAFFAAGAPPANLVDLAAGSGAAPADPSPGGWFQVTVLAELPDDAATTRVAGELRALLSASAEHVEDVVHRETRARLLDARSPAPLTPAEASAFERLGITSRIGIGWPGASDKAASAVLRLGRVLVVPGLKGDFSGQRPNPLAALLTRQGARVLVEGDPGGRATPHLDLTCEAPDDAAAARVAAALDHYLAAPDTFYLRPPWHPDGVTADEARARATFVALERAVLRVLQDPASLRGLDVQVVPGVDGGETLHLELQAALRRAALDAVDAVKDDAALDRALVDEYRAALAATGSPSAWHRDPAVSRRFAERLGTLTLDVSPGGAPGTPPRLEPAPGEAAFGALGRVRAHGRRVELGGLVFHRVARGLPELLRWLAAARCTDARLGLSGRT